VEYIAEHDDSLVEKFLNGEKISADELRASIRRSTIALKLVPVLAGSAFKNKGIQPLLDAVVDFLPRRWMFARRGHDSRRRSGVAARERRRAIFGIGVQDYVRPVRRTRDLLRVIPGSQGRQLRIQLHEVNA